MSVVIVGGNERMIRRYKELCQQYHCNAKVVIEMNGGLRDIGSPDLVILFTGTVSHKMVNCALCGIRGQNIGLRDIGSPDLVILFTGTVSHKMVNCALCGIRGQNIPVARCHSSSISALRNILETHVGSCHPLPR